MTTEDEIRRVLHPEAHERLGDAAKPMRYNPRIPLGDAAKPMRYNPRIPLGCDQQGRYPQAAEPCVDLDEIETHRPREPEPEPWWPKILGIVVAIIVIVLVFAPVGVGK